MRNRELGVTELKVSEIGFGPKWMKGTPEETRETAESFAMEKACADDPLGLDDPQAHGGLFGLGSPNDAYAQYFIGKSYLNPLTDPKQTQFVANVTFEPGCRNNWHIHHADEGGGQILLVTDGRGWYQEWGKEAQELHPGDCVTIPPNVKHWHGAAKDSWMSHVAFEACGTNMSNEWCEPVSDEEYQKL